jgi:hypothetical protein
MSSGISGSNFWIPVYLLWLGLEPRVAFWMSLATVVFGFGSGAVRNIRAGTIDWKLAGRHAAFAVPATMTAAFLATRAQQEVLLYPFALFATGLAVLLVYEFVRHEKGIEEVRRDGTRWPAAVLAGVLQGSIATGAGSVLLPALVTHSKLKHHATAVGSTVVVVFVCTAFAVASRIDGAMLETLRSDGVQIAQMIAFAGPGAAIGGQIGPRLAQRIPRRYLRLYVSVLLVCVGALVGLRAYGG